jgi:thiopurine S-methyltransferase
MRPDFWLERWTNDQIGFHQREINSMLQAHWSVLDVPTGATVFVPLCGKSLDMLWLRARGHEILGVELVQKAARDFFVEHRLTPKVSAQPPFERWEAEGVTLMCGDFFELTAADLHDIGAVYDRASLIALPTDMRQRYVEHMSAILRPGVETLLVTLNYPAGEMKGPPFSVTEAEVHALYDERFTVRRLADQDILEESALLRARGLTALTEQAYQLQRLRN